MKSISIVFSKHSSFNLFSSLIMFGLKTPFSHVAVKMTDGDTGQVVYYQASGLAVNCVSEAEFLAKDTVVYQKDVSVSDAVFVGGKTFAINQLGKPYYIGAILGFALQIALGMVHIKIKNPFKVNGSEYVCSQFAAALIDACASVHLDVREMDPLTLFQAIPSLPDVWD
jgi:hypothetical protein